MFFMSMFIQQILNPSQTALLLSTTKLTSPSGLTVTIHLDLTSFLITPEHFRRKHLHHQTGQSQWQVRYPLQDQALLLPSTFKFLLSHLWNTWRQQWPQTPLLQAANKRFKRKSLPHQRVSAPRLKHHCNQKLRRRRNPERKNPQIQLSQSRSPVSPRTIKETTTNWYAWKFLFLSNHSGFQFIS